MTSSKYALIENGEVVNTIIWDDEDDYEVPEGLILFQAPEEVAIGWKVIDDEWVASPPLPDPEPPAEDSTVLEAKNTAVQQLMALGITEAVARTIVGLPPLE